MLNQSKFLNTRSLESCELRERETERERQRELGAFTIEIVAEAKGPEGMTEGGGHE